jgi:hypothetical protein
MTTKTLRINNVNMVVDTTTGQVTDPRKTPPVLIFTIDPTTGRTITTPDTATYFQGGQITLTSAALQVRNAIGSVDPNGTQPTPPTNPPGPSPDSTGDQSGNGGTPVNVGTFAITSAAFNESDKQYKAGFLHYPEKMDPGQDRIVISQVQYEPPDVLTGGNIDFAKINAGGFSNERTFTRNLGTVVLPMPNDISETNVTAWGEDSLSSLAALVGGAALSGVINIAEGKVPEALSEIKSLFATATSQGSAANQAIEQLLTLNAAAALTQKAGINFNAEAFRSRITGTAINPNLELLFQGPKLRSFGFQFKMTPRSQREAQNIRYILKFFKKGMAPKRAGGSAAYFLGAPNVFNIHFRSSEKNGNDLKSIGKIKTCALQQFAVNYTPDGFYAAFQDSLAGGSQPIAVTMQLTFTELTPLYNDNYDPETDDIGFNSLKSIKDLPGPTQTPVVTTTTTSPPGPSRGGASAPASPTRPFQPGGSTAVPGLDFNPDAPGNSPVLGPLGIRGV